VGGQQQEQRRVITGFHRQDRWRTVGTLDAPCTVRLLETQGGWLRFWRLGECPGSMSGGSGWVRDASLVRLDPAASE
jgi:hypothetical protein